MDLGRATPAIADDLVQRVEAAFVRRIGAPRYQLWFPPNARFVCLGHEFVVVARNAHFQDWAADKFGPALRESVAEACGEVALRFVTDADLFTEKPAEPTPVEAPKPAAPQLNLFGEPAAPPTPKALRKQEKDNLLATAKLGRKWKSFAEFAVGPSNRVAAAAAQAIAEEPGLGPNPLVLHGPVGTGKTHLLEAIHVALRKRGSESRSLFVTAEEFTNRFVQSNRFNKMGTFRKQFRECSALLLDDLNFLENKKATQEEFLHTLDALTSDGRQVVVTTDCHPRLADKLIPELVDRLLGGAAWGLLPPDDETRLDILRRKSVGMASPPSEDVLKFLARNLKGNVRELEGAVNSVRHYAKVTGQPITVSLAREALGDLLRHVVRAISVPDVDAAVCQVLRLGAGQLQSKSRSWQVSHPRMLAIYLARKHTAATYGEIAKHFGVRQHSTAVAGEKKVRGWLASNETLALGDRRWTAKDLLDRVERELQR